MKRWYPNQNRLRELASAEGVTKAAEAILAFKRKDVLLALAFGWALLLVMTFTLIITIRFALALHG